MNYNSLQTFFQILIAVGIVVTAFGGFGAYYCGKRADEVLQHQMKEQLDKLLPSARVLKLKTIEKINSAGGFVEKAKFGEGTAVNFHRLTTSLEVVADYLSEIENLTDLSFNPPPGLLSISLKTITPLSRLTGLRRLDLSNTGISDIVPLSNLMALQVLFLRNNPITDISPVKNLKNIDWLDLDSTGVSDLTPLHSLTHLRILSLGETKVHDLTPLYELKDLEELDLHGIHIFVDVDDYQPTPVSDEQIDALQVVNTRVKIRSPGRNTQK